MKKSITEDHKNVLVKIPTVLKVSIERVTQALDLSTEEIELWLTEHNCPTLVQLQCLRLAYRYQLDPLSDEITILQNDAQNFYPWITSNGWTKLMNNHPQFAGISFKESTELTNNIPNWIECSIYRNDRILPIVAREYYAEVNSDQAMWQQMPRRLLKQRAITQCARLAFGISLPEASPIKQNSYTKQNSKDQCEENSTLLSDNLNQPSPLNLSHSDILKAHLSKRVVSSNN